MGWCLRLSDKTVRKFAELPIYYQRQKCSLGNVVSNSIRFMQIFAGVRWREGIKWEWGSWNGDFHFIRSLSSEHFTYMATRQLSRDTTVNDLGHISRSLDSFSHQISQKRWYGKSYYRQLIGNHTLAFDWRHFWWPWSTFEGHVSLGCHFHIHFSNPWHAFTSHGLPAIAEPLVIIIINKIMFCGTRYLSHCYTLRYVVLWRHSILPTIAS